MSFVEEAPQVADCVTGASFFFQHAYSTRLPHCYIGDMPRILVNRFSWQILCVQIEDLQEGDLIFLKDRAFKRLITHVAWFSTGMFHHVNRRGLNSESHEELMERYEQPFDGDKLTRYIDRRNSLCRYVHQGIFTS